MLARAPQPGFCGRTSNLMDVARRDIDDWLHAVTQGIVQSGPFEGMLLLRETAWKEARLSPQILGTYEEELHGEIERQIKRLSALPQPTVVVVGCAEGYYAVGLKRRLPNAIVYALDIDENALAICRRAAAANDVELVVAQPTTFLGVPDFIFMDCEGHEFGYLDPANLPVLTGINMIVEVHNLEGQQTDEILLDRFRGSHRINMLFEGPRNPNKFKELCGMSSEYRWLAVSEGRPCLMSWYVMEPKGVALA